MFSSILLLISAAEVSNPSGSTNRPTVQAAAETLAKCGLGPVTLRLNDPEMGGEDVIVAAGVKSATDEQLKCADKAVGDYYLLELPRDIQNRFAAIQNARLAPAFQAQARAWLSAKGLLSRVPQYRSGETDDASFTRQIEHLCGPKAHGAFQSQYGFHAISPAWVKRHVHPAFGKEEALTCLTYVTTVAGYRTGFIGNEYFHDK